MENQQQTTTLCRAGCGFFGSPSTEGLCSKCYKDYVKRKQDTTARVSPPLPAVVSSGANTATATSSAVSSATCNADNTAATSSTVIIAEKLREVSVTVIHSFLLSFIKMKTCSSGSELLELSVPKTRVWTHLTEQQYQVTVSDTPGKTLQVS